MLVKGERRGGRAPVCAPGAAAFLGSWLSAHGGARGAHQLETGVPEAVDYLGEYRSSIFLCQTVCQLFCPFLTVETTYTVVAGGEEESGLSFGGRCSGYAVLRARRYY